MLLQPIANLFNQLCIPQHVRTPMECISVDLGDCESSSHPFYFDSAERPEPLAIYGATFTSEVGNGLDPLMAPIIVSLVRERLFR